MEKAEEWGVIAETVKLSGKSFSPPPFKSPLCVHTRLCILVLIGPAGGQVDGRLTSGKKNVSVLIGSHPTAVCRILCAPPPNPPQPNPSDACARMLILPFLPPTKDSHRWALLRTRSRGSFLMAHCLFYLMSFLQGEQQTDVPR